MRTLGVDPGAARVGLALSDEEGRLALPFETVRRGKKVDECVRSIAALLEERGVRESLTTLVVGLPLRLDGTEGAAARTARAFGDALAAGLGMNTDDALVYWDERMTTVLAERALREMSVSGKARKDVVDQAAATLLLQSYLDAQQSKDTSTWPPETADPHDAGATNESAPRPTSRARRARSGRKRRRPKS